MPHMIPEHREPSLTVPLYGNVLLHRARNLILQVRKQIHCQFNNYSDYVIKKCIPLLPFVGTTSGSGELLSPSPLFELGADDDVV